jgi:hypothetical protein
MQHDALFFVGIFIFIFLVWVATGGPNHPISFQGPFLSSPTTGGNVTTYSLPQANFALGNSNADLPQISAYPSGASGSVSGSLLGISGQTDQLEQQVKAAAAFGVPSPYRGLVTISKNQSGPASSDPKQEYIEIDVSRQATAGIDITGWKLESVVTNYFGVINEGTKIPTTGNVNPEEPIILEPGDRAIVSTGISPIGVSFRENECTGYLGQYQEFSPPLENNCPDALTEFNNYYSVAGALRDDNCYNLVRNIPRCTSPSDETAGLSQGCFALLDNYLSYNGCVSAHKNDPDFAAETTWRVYLGQTDQLWKPSRDGIKLLDAQGQTVDFFTYN